MNYQLVWQQLLIVSETEPLMLATSLGSLLAGTAMLAFNRWSISIRRSLLG